jgi:hypothetical protein
MPLLPRCAGLLLQLQHELPVFRQQSAGLVGVGWLAFESTF